MVENGQSSKQMRPDVKFNEANHFQLLIINCRVPDPKKNEMYFSGEEIFRHFSSQLASLQQRNHFSLKL